MKVEERRGTGGRDGGTSSRGEERGGGGARNE